MSRGNTRRSFLKYAAACIPALSLFPGDIMAKALSPNPVDSQSGSFGRYFALAKGRLMDNGATPWFATILLGVPGQTMTVMMDTGTSNTWVTSSSCATEACTTKQYKYDPCLSSTHKQVAGAGWRRNDLGAWGEFKSLTGSDYLTVNDPVQGTTVAWMKFMSAILADAPGFENWKNLDMCGGVGFPVIFDR